MPNFQWKPLTRIILMKALGIFLALVFLALSLLFLAYPFVAVVTSQGGVEAKVVAISDHCHGMKSGCRVGGIYTLSVTRTEDKSTPKKKAPVFENVYGFYPAWPDQLQPLNGDLVQAWPGKKPLFAMPSTEGWGWFIVGTVLVVGLIMLEFAFLSLTLR